MNLVFVLQMIAFTIVALTICYIAGVGITDVLKIRFHWYSIFSIGFVALLGCLEVFGWFCVAFHMYRLIFEIIMLVIVAIFVVLGIQAIRKGNREISVQFDWAIMFVLMTIMALILLTCIFYRPDADDSFYVSNVALFADSKVINPYDSSFGIKNLGTVPMYDFQVWELFMAIVSNIFGVEAVTMMHTICLPWLLIISASATMCLGDVLTEGNTRQSVYFFVLMTVFHLFGGYAVFSEGSFLLSRLWQGKAVYLNVVLPVMNAIILYNIRKEARYFGVWMFLCIMAGIALNPTSMYVIGFELFAMTCLLAIVRKNKKYLLHIIPAVIGVAFFTIMIYIRASRFAGQIEAASSTELTFVKDTFLSFIGTGKIYMLLFVVAVMIIAIYGDTVNRVYAIYTPLLLLFTIWNPWIGRIVAEHVTMVPSYWRVFWLIPFGQAIIIATLLLYKRFWKNVMLRLVCIFLCVLAVSMPGKWMFGKDNGFIKANKVEKIPDEVIDFGEIILQEKEAPVILGCSAFSTTMRQKYTEVELVFSRYQYILDLFMYRGEQQQAEERIYLMNVVDGAIEDYSRLDTLLEKYSVDYVVIGSNNVGLRQKLHASGWKEKNSSAIYQLFGR